MSNRFRALHARSLDTASRSSWIALFALALAGCSGGGDGTAELFGAQVKATSRVAGDEVLGVGVVIPMAGFENAAADTLLGDFYLEMPADVRDKTFVQHLRINWLAIGHGPQPYGEPHFDLHFHRGTRDEIDAIDCSDTTAFPADILAAGYETPTLCVPAMGFHAWPSEDVHAHHPFAASMILGYYDEKMVFLEPMVTRARFLQRESFELPIARPKSAGGAPTLFPAKVTAAYDAMSDSYAIEFSEFSPID